MRESIEYPLWFLKQRQTACKLTVLQQDLDRPWTNPLAQEHFHLFLSADSGTHISLPSLLTLITQFSVECKCIVTNFIW